MFPTFQQDSIRILIAGFACTMALSGCGAPAGSKEAIPDPASARAGDVDVGQKVLRVGTSQTAPPIVFEKDGQIVGIEADLARRLAAALGRKLEFVPLYWPNLIPELRGRRIDIIMAGMSVTRERARKVAFTDPYLTVGQMALIRKDDLATLGTKQAILSTTARVGLEKGSTGEQFSRETLTGATKISLPTLALATESLIDGKVDVVVHDSPSIQWLAQKHRADGLVAVPGTFTTETLAWAVHPDDAELLEAANRVLSELKESGELKAIISQWLSE